MADKKSIYDDNVPPVPKSAPPIVIKQPPSTLEEWVRQGREAVQRAQRFVNVHVDMLTHKYSELQDVASETGKEIRANAEKEEVLPGLTYVGVAVLAGTIFARKRTFLIRSVLSPALFGGVAAYYFMPVTTRNTGNLIYRIEKAQVPQLAALQSSLVEKVENGVEYAEDSYKSLYGTVEGGVKSIRKQVKDKTGLLVAEEEELAKKASK